MSNFMQRSAVISLATVSALVGPIAPARAASPPQRMLHMGGGQTMMRPTPSNMLMMRSRTHMMMSPFFNPFFGTSPFRFGSFNPFFGTSPFGFGNVNPYAFRAVSNPYGTGYGMNPYAPYGGMSNPYSAYGSGSGGGGGGYGGGGGGGYGGGGQGNYGGGSQQTVPASYTIKPPTPAGADLSVFSALGLPSEHGRLTWPLGLRVLAPAAESQKLRDQIESLLPVMASQAPGGQGQSGTAAEATRAVSDLRKLLRNGGGAAMASFTLDEAEHFLDKLGRVLKGLP
jgi:hypothetical protein